MKQYKVLHAPTTVGGNPQGQCSALKKIGVNSISLTFSQNYFNYQPDQVLWQEDDSLLRKEWKRFRAFISSFFEFDVFHFNFGQSFFGPFFLPNPQKSLQSTCLFWLRVAHAELFVLIQIIELSLYRLFKKPIFITYQGSDARQGDYSRRHFEISIATQVDSSFDTSIIDKQRRRSISLFSTHCDQIYSLNPDLLWVLPSHAKFLPYSHVVLEEWLPAYTQMHSGPLRIAHAPTNRKVKGTQYVLDTVEKLRNEGHKLELLLVEGLSNSEARKVYESADILVDQLFAGWYGGLAVEAMALGKPVIVYIREKDLRFIPDGMKTDLPLIRSNSTTLAEVLRETIEMPRSELLELACRSRAYVEKWHNPLKIAAELQKDYEEALSRRGW